MSQIDINCKVCGEKITPEIYFCCNCGEPVTISETGEVDFTQEYPRPRSWRWVLFTLLLTLSLLLMATGVVNSVIAGAVPPVRTPQPFMPIEMQYGAITTDSLLIG